MCKNTLMSPFEAESELLRESVHHPKHYNSHPSGVECIEITRFMNFNLGNAFKYIFRRNDKDDILTNLKKAEWYIQDELTYGQPTESLNKETIMKLGKIISYELNNFGVMLVNLAICCGDYETLERTLKLVQAEISKIEKTK